MSLYGDICYILPYHNMTNISAFSFCIYGDNKKYYKGL